MTEKTSPSQNFEQKYNETEQTFLPIFPDKISRAFSFQADTIIDQVYLSHPADEYNLRLRRIGIDKDKQFTPTLKDRGARTKDGLQRKEVNGTMTENRFWSYAKDVPRVNKFRATPFENIDIDFFDDGHIHLESENPESWQQFIRHHDMENDFIEVTGDRIVSSEWRAQMKYRKDNNGREAFAPKSELNIDAIRNDILRVYSKKKRVVVALGGRSGSGKSTLVRQIVKNFDLSSAVMSTDDYNHGNTHLYGIGGGQWENYDDDKTYDLPLCRSHLGQLASGLVIPKRSYSFITQEPQIDGDLQPVDVIFIEGIKAHHPQFREMADLYYEMPTSLATSIGRRVLKRDIVERPLFSPEENLTNYLEYTEPAYKALL